MFKIIPQVLAAPERCTTLGGCHSGSPLENLFKADGAIDWSTTITFVADTLFFLAAVVFLVYLIWGGINYITSGGDKGKAEHGRDKIVFAIIGMVIVASSFAIWRLVLQVLGMNQLHTGI